MSVPELVLRRGGTRSAEEYRSSACEDCVCEMEDYVCCSAVILEV
jgi:hypothetical protein